MSTPEYEKMWRAKMKNSHRCVRCGKQDSRTLSGNSCCEICLNRQRAYNAKRRHHKKINGKISNFYQIRKIVCKASALGLSYGQYMSKYHSD